MIRKPPTSRKYKRGKKRSKRSHSVVPLTDQHRFRTWFGDSKVVDENNKPLKVYHGTMQHFDSFDPDKAITRANRNYYGDGLFFAENYDSAWQYATSDRARAIDGDVLLSEIQKNHPVEFYELAKNMISLTPDGYSRGFDAFNLNEMGTMIREYELNNPNFDINNFFDVIKWTQGYHTKSDEIDDTFVDIFSGGSSTPSVKIINNKLDTLGLGDAKLQPRVISVYLQADKVRKTKNQDVAKKAQDKGYDAVRYNGVDIVGDSAEWVVYDPDQVWIVNSIGIEEIEDE